MLTGLWKPEGVDGLEVARSFFHSTYRPPEAHERLELGMTFGGVGKSYYRGSYEYVHETDLVVFQPGERHSGHLLGAAGKLARQFIYFEPKLLCSVISDLAGSDRPAPYFPQLLASDHARAFQNLFKSLTTDVPKLERQSKLLAFLISLIEEHADVPPLRRRLGRERTPVERARRHLDEHFSAPVSLDELATVARLNKDYLLEVFRRDLGVSPHVYQTHLRLERAKTLLAQGKPVAQVALEVGFTDQSHLTKRFRQHLGLPGLVRIVLSAEITCYVFLERESP
jgi:AraC-like DNA-binding protein